MQNQISRPHDTSSRLAPTPGELAEGHAYAESHPEEAAMYGVTIAQFAVWKADQLAEARVSREDPATIERSRMTPWERHMDDVERGLVHYSSPRSKALHERWLREHRGALDKMRRVWAWRPTAQPRARARRRRVRRSLGRGSPPSDGEPPPGSRRGSRGGEP